MGNILAIDPGKNTGWASFSDKGEFEAFGVIRGEDKFLDWLEEQAPGLVIIERYLNRGGFINSFSDMPTSQHIGAIKRICRKRKIPYVEQDPSPALTIGLRFLGLHEKYVGKHVPDNVSAMAHGEYYIRKNRLRESNEP